MENSKTMNSINIENYEISASLTVGEKDIFIGKLKPAHEGKEYVCGYKKHIDNATTSYSGICDSDEFFEISELFGQRIADASKTARRAALEKKFK